MVTMVFWCNEMVARWGLAIPENASIAIFEAGEKGQIKKKDILSNTHTP